MNKRFARLAGAVTLAFAAATGTAIAQSAPATNSNDNARFTQEADTTNAPAAPVKYTAASPELVLLGCTKDNHAFRVLVIAGAPVTDVQAGSLPTQQFLVAVQDALKNTLSQFETEELRTSPAPFDTLNKAINESIKAFNALNQTKFALVIADYGLTHKPDPICSPQSAAPQP